MTIHHIMQQHRPTEKPIATIHVGDCDFQDEVDLFSYLQKEIHLGRIFFIDWMFDIAQGIIRIEAHDGVPDETLDQAVSIVIGKYKEERV